jgi:hypothetical protein
MVMVGDRFMTFLMVDGESTAVQGSVVSLIDDTLWEVTYGDVKPRGNMSILHEKDMLPTDRENPQDNLGVLPC